VLCETGDPRHTDSIQSWGARGPVSDLQTRLCDCRPRRSNTCATTVPHWRVGGCPQYKKTHGLVPDVCSLTDMKMFDSSWACVGVRYCTHLRNKDRPRFVPLGTRYACSRSSAVYPWHSAWCETLRTQVAAGKIPKRSALIGAQLARGNTLTMPSDYGS
jgi:hypothetical protein